MNKIIKYISQPLFFRQPASFEFSGSKDAGLELLSKNIINQWHWLSFRESFKGSLVGKITDSSEVSVWHYKYSLQLWFIPLFVGRFISVDGKTFLSGEYRLHPWTKKANIFYMLFIFVFMVLLSMRGNVILTAKYIFIFFVLLPGIFGVFLLFMFYIGYLTSKPDIKFIETKLTEILKKNI